MKQISAQEFNDLLTRQKSCTGEEDRHEFDVAHADLSGVRFSSKDLAGTTIAMSRIKGVAFNSDFELYGLTWIGNDIVDCTFVDLSLGKAEILDCEIRNSSFEKVSLNRTELTGTVFQECTFRAIDFSEAHLLLNTSFRNCRFENSRFPTLKVENATGDLLFSENEEIITNTLQPTAQSI